MLGPIKLIRNGTRNAGSAFDIDQIPRAATRIVFSHLEGLMMNVLRRVRSHRLGQPDWEAYCYARNRSFDPVSGAYRGRDTARQFFATRASPPIGDCRNDYRCRRVFCIALCRSHSSRCGVKWAEPNRFSGSPPRRSAPVSIELMRSCSSAIDLRGLVGISFHRNEQN